MSPVCLKKKERRFERLRFAVGAPVDVKALYMEKPSLTRIEEIAKLLGVPAATVYTRLARGREKLRRELESEGYE